MPYRISTLRSRAVAYLAIVALLPQAFATGWVTIGGAAAHADEIGVICHGEAGGTPYNTPAPSKSCQLCCLCCASAALATVDAPSLSRLQPRAIAALVLLPRVFVAVRAGAVRAGRSQGPPSLA